MASDGYDDDSVNDHDDEQEPTMPQRHRRLSEQHHRGRRRLDAAVQLLRLSKRDEAATRRIRMLVSLAANGDPNAGAAVDALRAAKRHLERHLTQQRRVVQQAPRSFALAGVSPGLAAAAKAQGVRPWWHYLNPLLAFREGGR